MILYDPNGNCVDLTLYRNSADVTKDVIKAYHYDWDIQATRVYTVDGIVALARRWETEAEDGERRLVTCFDLPEMPRCLR